MIYNDKDSQELILEGAKIIYDAVRTTLGPKGRNVLIRDKFRAFTVTHDGVTVARATNLEDSDENYSKQVGIDLIKEASKQMDTIGDGTTTVTVLTYHLIVEAFKLIDAGENAMVIRKKLEAEIEPLIAAVDKMSKKIEKNLEDVQNVTTVSVGNAELGKQIAELMVQIGFDSAISVETTKSPETTFKVVEGFTFDRGYMSPYFVNNISSREAVMNNPAVILVNGPVVDLAEYKNLFEAMGEQDIKNILFIAENFEADALNSLILNTVKKHAHFVAVKTPGYGDNKLENLRDIAAYTGAPIIDPSVGDWQNALGINSIGAAERVVVGFDETMILGGQGKKEVEQRIEKLKKRIRKVKKDEVDEIKNRIARLKGSVGIIKVGGQTDTEADEKKYRIDDAVAAAKAAMKGGIVPGGGVCLRDIGFNYDSYADPTEFNVAIKKVLCMPEALLLENAGIDPVLPQYLPGTGMNVITDKEVNMFEAGIIDPADVTKEAIRNAIATACLAITVGGTIVETPLTREQMTSLMQAGN